MFSGVCWGGLLPQDFRVCGAGPPDGWFSEFIGSGHPTDGFPVRSGRGQAPPPRVWLSPDIKDWVYSVNYWINGFYDLSLFKDEVGERFAEFFKYIATSKVVKDIIGGCSTRCVFLFPFSPWQNHIWFQAVKYIICQMDKGVYCHYKLGDFHC